MIVHERCDGYAAFTDCLAKLPLSGLAWNGYIKMLDGASYTLASKACPNKLLARLKVASRLSPKPSSPTIVTRSPARARKSTSLSAKTKPATRTATEGFIAIGLARAAIRARRRTVALTSTRLRRPSVAKRSKLWLRGSCGRNVRVASPATSSTPGFVASLPRERFRRLHRRRRNENPTRPSTILRANALVLASSRLKARRPARTPTLWKPPTLLGRRSIVGSQP